MNNNVKMIPLRDLNLTDRFLFSQVMEDPLALQDALSIIFGHDIPLLTKSETEKELQEWEEKYYAKQEAREEGLKEGLLEGLQKGLQEGLEERLQKGKEERDRELIKNSC